MDKIKHKTGIISTHGIQAISWNTPTSATIWWQGGLIGTFEFEERDAEVMRTWMDMDAGHTEEALYKFREKGKFWHEKEMHDFRESMKDEEHQRERLRLRGIYLSEVLEGRFTMRVVSEDGKSEWSWSGNIKNGKPED